jgi:hypothetical protein
LLVAASAVMECVFEDGQEIIVISPHCHLRLAVMALLLFRNS